jgi:hypothetical protein
VISLTFAQLRQVHRTAKGFCCRRSAFLGFAAEMTAALVAIAILLGFFPCVFSSPSFPFDSNKVTHRRLDLTEGEGLADDADMLVSVVQGVGQQADPVHSLQGTEQEAGCAHGLTEHLTSDGGQVVLGANGGIDTIKVASNGGLDAGGLGDVGDVGADTPSDIPRQQPLQP